MKKAVVLLLMFLAVTGVLYYGYNINKDKEVGKGDAPSQVEEPKPTFGEVDFEPVNDTITISQIQVDYIRYINDEITFDEQINTVLENLKTVSNVPFTARPDYLFSSGFAEDSKVQYYYLGNKEKTRTVVFRVELGEKENKVSIAHDGPYYTLVIASDDNPKTELLGLNNGADDVIIKIND